MVWMSANGDGFANTWRELEGLEVVAVFFVLGGLTRDVCVGFGASKTESGGSSDAERMGLSSVAV